MREISAALVDEACAGDPRAVGAVVRLVDPDLRGVAWAVVRNQHQVDDIMQSTYEKAFRQIREFKRESNIKTWLHSITYRTAIDHVRYEGRRRHEDVDTADLGSTDAGVDTAGRTAEINLAFAEIMNRLDPETRVLLMLTSALGHSQQEAAEITGQKLGTVASRLARAKERLRKEMA